jgi:hypothetical protein
VPKNFRLSDEGLCAEGRKDHEALMVVEREACVEGLVRHEAAILWIPILEIFAIFCGKILRLSDEGLCTEGRKDHEALMVVEREACIEGLVRREAAILWIPILEIFAIFCAKKFPTIGRKGIRTEGRKDREGLMVVEREACVGASAVLEG